LIELHLHLEGAVYPSDALRFSGLGYDEIGPLYRHKDFSDFLSHFGRIASFLKSREDFARLLENHLKRLKTGGCVYAEFRLSPSVWDYFGLDAEETLGYILGLRFPWAPEYRFIVEAVRQWDTALIERDLKLALMHKDKVRGFGLGGDEIKAPVENFSALSEECAKNGIALIPHAGEVGSSEQVWKAVRLGAKRIGHGIRSADDKELCGILKEENIHLEICPTSNYKTGAVKEGAIHPLSVLHERRVPFSISTDDPGIFLTTLRKELHAASKAASLGRKELAALQMEALRASLLAPAEKERLKTSFL
jgi:adenosine deaminase